MTNNTSNSSKAIACRIPISDYIAFQREAQAEGITMNDWLLRRIYANVKVENEAVTGTDESFSVSHQLHGNIYFDNVNALKEAFKDSLDRIAFYQQSNAIRESSINPEDKTYTFIGQDWIERNEEPLFKALIRIARHKASQDGDMSIYREVKDMLTDIWDYLFVEGCEWGEEEEQQSFGGIDVLGKLLGDPKVQEVLITGIGGWLSKYNTKGPLDLSQK